MKVSFSEYSYSFFYTAFLLTENSIDIPTGIQYTVIMTVYPWKIGVCETERHFD